MTFDFLITLSRLNCYTDFNEIRHGVALILEERHNIGGKIAYM